MEVIAFFASLVWWEIIALVALIIGFSIGLFRESSTGTGIIIVIFIAVFWSHISFIYNAVGFWGIVSTISGYLMIGGVWSLWKWKDYVKSEIEYVKTQYDIPIVEDFRKEAFNRIKRNMDYDIIGFWILMWPFSVTGYLFNDILSKFARVIFGGVYEKITLYLINKSI